MKKTTLNLINELAGNYNVKVEGKDFMVDGLTFTEWGDNGLLVTYLEKTGFKDHKGDPEYDTADQIIGRCIDEVMWWINSERDY